MARAAWPQSAVWIEDLTEDQILELARERLSSKDSFTASQEAWHGKFLLILQSSWLVLDITNVGCPCHLMGDLQELWLASLCQKLYGEFTFRLGSGITRARGGDTCYAATLHSL